MEIQQTTKEVEQTPFLLRDLCSLRQKTRGNAKDTCTRSNSSLVTEEKLFSG